MALAHRVVLASSNPGKLRELRALLRGTGIDVRAQSEFAAPKVAERGASFVENALLKARSAARACRLPAIGDDSGLMVDALDGAPGIRSARYAGEDAGDKANLALLLERVAGLPDDRCGADFVCAAVYLRDETDPLPIVCVAKWRGRIIDSPSGEHGFGYDPIFHLPAHGCTSAELSHATKNALSHRGRAMRGLIRRLHDEGVEAKLLY